MEKFEYTRARISADRVARRKASLLMTAIYLGTGALGAVAGYVLGGWGLAAVIAGSLFFLVWMGAHFVEWTFGDWPL